MSRSGCHPGRRSVDGLAAPQPASSMSGPTILSTAPQQTGSTAFATSSKDRFCAVDLLRAGIDETLRVGGKGSVSATRADASDVNSATAARGAAHRRARAYFHCGKR